MDEAAESSFLNMEVDFDYEFDASRYFDFVRVESPSEVWDAEFWFETAGSYPPSPFMSKMVLEKDVLAESVNDSGVRFYSERAAGGELYVFDDIPKVQDCILQDRPQNDKRFVFDSSMKSSTLMKPTVSHLAKQSPRHQVRYDHRTAHRSLNPLTEEPVKKLKYDLSENGVHASKRQKLEGGVRQKQVVAEKQHVDYIHKIPEKIKLTSTCIYRLTIPREVELKTAQRTQKMRVQRPWLRSNIDQQSHEDKRPAPTSKSHPCDRQSFKSMASKRDIQHFVSTSLSLAASSHIPSKSSEQGVIPHLKCSQLQPFIASRFVSDDKEIHNNENILPKFTARALNKKIMSKGDIGVFSNAKREATKPMEFKLSTNKRFQQDLPTELFNKLSLNSDVQQSSANVAKPKDSVWNKRDIMQQEHKENIGCSLKNGRKLFGFENETFNYSRLEETSVRRNVIR